MNGTGSVNKKASPCRYFLSSGTCFYGDCKFLHKSPRSNHSAKTVIVNQSPQQNSHDTATNRGGSGMNSAMNGDQYFNATFGGTNGLSEFQAFSSRSKSARSSPLSHIPDLTHMKTYTAPPPQHAPGLGNAQLIDQFATVHLNDATPTKVALKIQSVTQGRNPGASEFVPKSNSALTHSSSSPNFATFMQMSNHTPTSIPTSIAGISPLNSPMLSPTGSPLLGKRDKSPGPQSLPTASTPTSQQQQCVQENVGGTTYFYTQEDIAHQNQVQGVVMPNFSMYPNIPPHIAHMKLKSNMPAFFMPDEIKMDTLNKQVLSLVQMDPEHASDIPQEVDTYQCLFPLEPPPASPVHKSSRFGFPSTCYKAINSKDGLMYCLRRVHGFRLVHTKCMALIAIWKKLQHANIVSLREVFTTKAFGDHSMVFVYDFHAAAETLMMRHFQNHPMMNGYSSSYQADGSSRQFTPGKGGNSARQQEAGLLPESVIWSYVVQLSSALRTIHAHGLACRVMDPTKILVTGKSRLRLNCEGILDVLTFDANQSNPLSMMPHYQQEDLVSLGKVVLALACNSVVGIQRDHLQTSMELVNRNYSADLKNLILYLLSNRNQPRSVNDIMPMIGARFYTQLDAAQLYNDVLENELSKEVENGRLFRIVTKLGAINDRPEFHMDPSWSETGDRYMLKLFRDYVFHQVDENGAPWMDMAHVISCLNKLDAGIPEKICLMSRDEQSVLVASYAEIKQCFESAFSELSSNGHEASMS